MGETGLLAILEYCTTVGGSYTPLTSVKDFKVGGFEKKTIQVKVLGNEWTTELSGFKSGGTIDVSCEHLDAETSLTLATLLAAKAPYFWKLLLNNAVTTVKGTLSFQAILSKTTPCSIDEEGKITNNITLTVSDAPTYVVAS